MISIDEFLHLYFKHIDTTIEVLFLVVTGLVISVLIFALKKSESQESSINEKITEVQSLLRDYTEQTIPSSIGDLPTIPAGEGPDQRGDGEENIEILSQDSMASQDNGPSSGEGNTATEDRSASSGMVTELQKEVDEKELQIRELESQLAAKSAGTAEVTELQSKVEDLQARLSEYEIIEDDIADLSLYKEENERLKQELEELKQQKSEAAAPEPATSAEPQKGAEVGDQDLEQSATLDETSSPKESQTTPDSEAPSSASPELTAEAPTSESSPGPEEEDGPSELEALAASLDDDGDEKRDSSESPDADNSSNSTELIDQESIGSIEVPEDQDGEMATEYEQQGTADALLAQFQGEASSGEDQTSTDIPNEASKASPSLDTEKVMGELEELNKVSTELPADEAVLPEELDTEKMVSEALEMDGTLGLAPDDDDNVSDAEGDTNEAQVEASAQEGKDEKAAAENEELVHEFQNFLKSQSS